MKKIISLALITGVISSTGFAGGPGTTAAQFLKIDPSARPAGMGGAYSAVVNNSDAVFYNPAGIAGIKEREISGTYMSYFQSVNYGNIAGVIPNGDISSFGIGINYLGVSDIPKRSADDVDDPDGTLEPESTFGSMDTAINLVYAAKNPFPKVLDGLDAGVNLKTVYLTIVDESAFSSMLDLGGLYPVNDKLSVALNIQNVGMGVKFKSKSDPLPLNIKAGAAYMPIEALTVAVDINEYILDETLYASVGAEYRIMDMIAFRTGYKYGYDTDNLGSLVGLSGGFGVKAGRFGLDYAMAPFGELGNTHRISFGAKF
ncbi:MAG: PorV/PorQ family protein [Elusimicrobia bacterium]|jgi:hypothetical protein|nr:PorV/PorQ family protein [Elusimicrobiota bacterium]